MLSFGAGEMSKTFAVTIHDDTLGEDDETVGLTLSSPTGRATLGPRAKATLTIRENERVVQFAGARLTRSEAAAVIVVKRSDRMAGTATVRYATAGGSASAGSDYLAQSGDLTFGRGAALNVHPLAAPAGAPAPRISAVELLGCRGDLAWRQEPDGLIIALPEQAPGEHAHVFRISGDGLVPPNAAGR